MRDNLVVRVRLDGGDVGLERGPEGGDAFGGLGIGLGQRGDEDGAALERSARPCSQPVFSEPAMG